MNAEMSAVMKRQEEREALRLLIQQWNANRLDLFELSEPNEDLDFHGVMRFYFQDSGQKVATKCIRVASDATAQDVIDTLIEKFRPDMRMLSLPEYALFEIHENGEEKKLAMTDKPLMVQLNWNKDDREGRFLLKNVDDATNMPANTFQQEVGGSSFRRKLSKREKKELKKQEKLNRIKSTGDDDSKPKVAEKLYNELPETSFTRSISNPEAVMRRRRQQKLEKRLQLFRSKDGGPDSGGTLKIYGEALCRDVPYKTLLLSIRDTAAQVVQEMLSKYGLDKEDPHNYCLVQVTGGHRSSDSGENNVNINNNNLASNQDYILDDDECPLAILMTQPDLHGSIMFHVRRRPADYHPRKRKKKPTQQQKWNSPNGNVELIDYRYEAGLDRLPFLIELNHDGTDVVGNIAGRHRLYPNVTEVGSEVAGPSHGGSSGSPTQCIRLSGPSIQPRHCVINTTNQEGIVTVTPCSRDADTYVNGQRIYETTILQNGYIVKFGRLHCFRFLDPCFEERMRQRQDVGKTTPHDYSYDSGRRESEPLQYQPPPPPLTDPHNFETTFDVDGNVETRSTSSHGGTKDDARSQRSLGSISTKDRIPMGPGSFQRIGSDPILPAVLEVREESEEALLHAIVIDLDPTLPTFRLAPAYCLYLMARYRASTHFRPDLTPNERAHKLTLTMSRVSHMIVRVIQERHFDVKSLALWLANSSELLNFLKSDRHISAFSIDAQETLAEAVQMSFRNLVRCIQSELSAVMPYLFIDKDDIAHGDTGDTVSDILNVLASVMALLRRCRVNAALTIQLFSQLFYFINVWSFNRLVSPTYNYCSRLWGLRLKSRLAHIENWAERQGLELAADCHLARIVQATQLLQAPKYTSEDLAALSSQCFKLNSLQLRAILSKYQSAPDEPKLTQEIIERAAKIAENLADELARSDGREVKLEEEAELVLPFLLPEDGYSCEVVRGVPQGLVEFVAPMQHAALCRLSPQVTSSGSWTVYMGQGSIQGSVARSSSAMSNASAYLPAPTRTEPEVHVIKLHKSNNGMGLSIVAAKGAGQDKLGIYIKSVVKGGAADADGRLQAGDQLLKVDGQCLVGITQEKAAEYLVRTGPTVTLEVAKDGAIYHGLATLLTQPSPVMSRGPRKTSERDVPGPRVPMEQPPPLMHSSKPQMHSSKSVPSLNSAGESPTVPSASVVNRYSQDMLSHHSGTSYNTRTSTAPSKPLDTSARSRSSQNLNDKQFAGYPPPTANGSSRPVPNGPVSPPHRLYPHQQHPMYHQHVQQQQQILLQQQQQQQQGGLQQQQGGHHQQPYASPEPERFYQNLSVYKTHMQQNGCPPQMQGAAPLSPQHDRNPAQFQRSFRGSQSSLLQNRSPQEPQPPSQMRDRPASAYIQKENYPPAIMTASMNGRSQSARDMMRQEAKLQEIGEEVRRRELRAMEMHNNYIAAPGQYNHNAQIPAGSPGQTYPPRFSGHSQGYRELDISQGGRSPGRQSMRPPHLDETGYRESPPPPPPPPTSTHPLYQGSPPGHRYNASVGEPPKGGYFPSSPVASTSKAYPIPGTNPWEREEREREVEMRRAAAKEWRAHQIAELTALGGSRNHNQEEQLRALRLEIEFERRAQEEPTDEEEDTEAAERVQDVMRATQAQDEMRFAAANRTSATLPRQPTNQQQYHHMNGNAVRYGSAHNISNEEKERLRRMKEMKMKQAEMDAIRADELRFKQKEDENRFLPFLNQQPIIHNNVNNNNNVSFNNAVSPNRPTVTSPTHHRERPNHLPLDHTTAPHQRLDNLLEQRNGGSPSAPPPPPERGSSYQNMRTSTSTNGMPANSSPPKKVSFNDSNLISEAHLSNSYEKIMEDPNRFINEAESMLASPRSPDVQFSASTPGVIGNQEVYKDPRQRRLAEQQHQKLLSNQETPVPEKLSFKEKMKMFAMENGEGTPREKNKKSLSD